MKLNDKPKQENSKEENINIDNFESSKWKETKKTIIEFWKEFKQVKYGLVGVALFFIFVLLIFLEPYIVPFPEVNDRWGDVTYWEENPRTAAPIWTNWFGEYKAEHEFIRETEVEIKDLGRMKMLNGSFIYDFDYDLPPKDLVFKANGKGNLNITIEVERPDGKIIEVVRRGIRTSGKRVISFSLGNEGARRLYRFAAAYESEENKERFTADNVRSMFVLFGEADEGMMRKPIPLTGDYKINYSIAAVGEDSMIEDPYLIASGQVFGLFGTDTSKRDIWSGVIAGIKWAMLLGLLVAIISVAIGAIYGITAAYFGGKVDTIMMRIFEVFRGIPMLPVLIVLSAIFSPSIWLLLLMMCALYWRGPVLTIRSMGLQIREETYIEAAHALDATHSRIIFKHMIPQVIPLCFASMALRVPMAIVIEASVSLLGLGDSTIVTWGQILHGAMNGGAVLQGLWWWVIPPGLFIATMGMTFAFIGFAMDKILNPKLKTR